MKDNIKFSLSFVSVATVYAVLVSYGYITTYYASYLANFNVSIQDINFWPSLYDFLTKGTLVMVSLIALIILFVAMSLGVNGIAACGRWLGKKTNQKWLMELSELSVMSKRYILLCTSIVLVVTSVALVFGSAHNQGAQEAMKKKSFTVIHGTDNDVDKVIIYQNGGSAVVKAYDKNNQEFLPSYSVIDLTNETYGLTKLNR